MLASKLYSPTLREIPSDAVVVSHQYMLKAGMMRKVSNGLYAFLPLALRSVRKVEEIVREEMNASEPGISCRLPSPLKSGSSRNVGMYMEKKCSN